MKSKTRKEGKIEWNKENPIKDMADCYAESVKLFGRVSKVK